VAALLNIRHKVSYDGQAAIELEALAESTENEAKSPFRKGDLGGFATDLKSKSLPTSLSKGRGYSYKIVSLEGTPQQLDFSPMFSEILDDLRASTEISVIAHRFHKTVAAATTEMCLRISVSTGLNRVILSGGVFQNRLLSEMIYTALTKQGLQVFTHRLVPPNDGGIALGQAAIAGRRSI
jgi:hydrogenase maturation protein HypF